MRRLEQVAAGLSLLAAGIHVMAGPTHLAEWWAYGLFFFAAATAQAAYGLLVVTQGIEGWGGWIAVRRRVYRLGIVLNVAILAIWVVSRTLGVPVGPEAFEPESVGVLDASSKVTEIALVLVLLRLLALERRAAVRRPA